MKPYLLGKIDDASAGINGHHRLAPARSANMLRMPGSTAHVHDGGVDDELGVALQGLPVRLGGGCRTDTEHRTIDGKRHRWKAPQMECATHGMRHRWKAP